MPSYIDTPTKGARWHRLTVELEGRRLDLWSAAGLFSKGRLDPGTRLLIESVPARRGWRVLDLGCGIGVAGLALLLRERVEVTFSDVNPLALKATARNLAAFGLAGRIVCSDLFAKIPEAFDLILTNPPIVAGRATLYALIEEAPAHLQPGGALALVARHNKGGKMLAKRMESVFGAVEVLGRRSGYHVYASRKPKA